MLQLLTSALLFECHTPNSKVMTLTETHIRDYIYFKTMSNETNYCLCGYCYKLSQCFFRH